MCPRCRQNAPIVYRGVAAYCTACGAPRIPLASNSVNLAGQGSKVGGTITRAIGWVILVSGLSIALTLALLLQWLFTSMTALIVGLPIAITSVAFAVLLLRSGTGLVELGTGEQRDARTKAIFALAQNRGGNLTAMDVSQALDLRLEEADHLLTHLAKTIPDQVSLEVDDAGGIYFRFPSARLGPSPWQGQNVRVDASVGPRVQGAQTAEAELLDAEVIPPPTRHHGS
jgi:hypothetical protein